MYIPFENLPPDARIWIYVSNRKLTAETRTAVEEVLAGFTQQWSAHATPLQASYKIFFDQFIVLGVDEAVSSPSGCSIFA